MEARWRAEQILRRLDRQQARPMGSGHRLREPPAPPGDRQPRPPAMPPVPSPFGGVLPGGPSDPAGLTPAERLFEELMRRMEELGRSGPMLGPDRVLLEAPRAEASGLDVLDPPPCGPPRRRPRAGLLAGARSRSCSFGIRISPSIPACPRSKSSGRSISSIDRRRSPSIRAHPRGRRSGPSSSSAPGGPYHADPGGSPRQDHGHGRPGQGDGRGVRGSEHSRDSREAPGVEGQDRRVPRRVPRAASPLLRPAGRTATAAAPGAPARGHPSRAGDGRVRCRRRAAGARAGDAARSSEGKGALVRQVAAGSQAAALGLQRFDVILELDGTVVTDVRHLDLTLREKAAAGAPLTPHRDPSRRACGPLPVAACAAPTGRTRSSRSDSRRRSTAGGPGRPRGSCARLLDDLPRRDRPRRDAGQCCRTGSRSPAR